MEKHFRGLNRNTCEQFWEQVSKSSSFDEVPPIIATPKYYFLHVQREGIFYLAIVSKEVAPLFVLELLHRVADTFTLYFEKATESIIKENFVTVYQVRT